MDYDQFSVSERIHYAYCTMQERMGLDPKALQPYMVMKDRYDKLARRVDKLGASPEDYVMAQFEGLDRESAAAITIPYLVKNAGRCNKMYEQYKRRRSSQEEDYLGLSRYYRHLVLHTAKKRGCGVYDVVNDLNFTLPDWFRVLNSNDAEIIEMHRKPALADMCSAAFLEVKEKLRSVHE